MTNNNKLNKEIINDKDDNVKNKDKKGDLDEFIFDGLDLKLISER